MKSKSTLIPKRKMWISLLVISLPVALLLLFKSLAPSSLAIDYTKLLRIVASFSFIGMFLLFMTQWTKDDGDEMYLQLRLRSVLYGVITGITTLFVTALFSLVKWLDFDYAHYNAFGLMFFILLIILFHFGLQIRSLTREK